MTKSVPPPQSSTFEKLAAVMVLFHPESSVTENIRAVASQVETVFIIDNTPSALDSQPSVDYEGDDRVLHAGQNLGLGTAYNLACQQGLELGYEWMLLLDQDTELHSNYRARMSSIFANWALASDSALGIAAPSFTNSQAHSTDAEPETTVTNSVDAAISSGSLVNLSAWKEVGGFREDFFIDYVDTEFCRRLVLRGFSVVMAAEVLMSHGMGNLALNRVLTYERYSSNYPAWRHYFIARNFIMSLKASLPRGDWSWAVREFRRRLKFTILTMLMEPERRSKLSATVRGCVDGLRGRVDFNPIPHD